MKWLFALILTAAYSEPIWLEGMAMEMPWRLCIEKEQKEAKALVHKTFCEIETTFSLYVKDSELIRLNRAPIHKQISLSPPLAHLLRLALQMHTISEGRFDPTCGKIKQIWVAALDAKQPLTEAIIADLKKCSGPDKIRLKKNRITKRTAVVIDLDGIAKGYAIDQVVERLLECGHTNCFFEWSGDMRAAGRHPSGRPWQVALPGDDRLITLENCAIAGSGDYLQNWRGYGIEKEELFSHFASPKTGRLNKVGRIAGVTVKARTCAVADALATSAMLIQSLEEFDRWSRRAKQSIDGLEFWPLIRGEK